MAATVVMALKANRDAALASWFVCFMSSLVTSPNKNSVHKVIGLEENLNEGVLLSVTILNSYSNRHCNENNKIETVCLPEVQISLQTSISLNLLLPPAESP